MEYCFVAIGPKSTFTQSDSVMALKINEYIKINFSFKEGIFISVIKKVKQIDECPFQKECPFVMWWNLLSGRIVVKRKNKIDIQK